MKKSCLLNLRTNVKKYLHKLENVQTTNTYKYFVSLFSLDSDDRATIIRPLEMTQFVHDRDQDTLVS